jgi:hypothetical protein
MQKQDFVLKQARTFTNVEDLAFNLSLALRVDCGLMALLILRTARRKGGRLE